MTDSSESISGDQYADLTSYDAFTKGVPHATFARLRRENPVAWFEETEGKGFWSITRHKDIITLNRDNQRFSSAHGIRIEEQTPEEVEARRTFQETDPPEHTVIRNKYGNLLLKYLMRHYKALNLTQYK